MMSADERRNDLEVAEAVAAPRSFAVARSLVSLRLARLSREERLFVLGMAPRWQAPWKLMRKTREVHSEGGRLHLNPLR